MDEQTQELARRSLDQLERSHARVSADASAMQRWALGSLLILNVSAALWLAGMHEEVSSSVSIRAAGYFFAGGVASAAAILTGWVFSLFQMQKIIQAVSHFAKVSIDHNASNYVVGIAGSIRKLSQFNIAFTSIILIISVILFGLGTAVVANGSEFTSNSARRANQSAQPSKLASSPALPNANKESSVRPERQEIEKSPQDSKKAIPQPVAVGQTRQILEERRSEEGAPIQATSIDRKKITNDGNKTVQRREDAEVSKKPSALKEASLPSAPKAQATFVSSPSKKTQAPKMDVPADEPRGKLANPALIETGTDREGSVPTDSPSL